MGSTTWDKSQLLAYERRNAPKCRQPVEAESVPAGTEKKLQADIMAWCDSQFPRWKYICARSDKPHTFQVGAHDLTVWGPYPLCILVEAKTASGKLSEAQQVWKAEMDMLRWPVEVVRSLQQFLAIATKAVDKPKPLCNIPYTSGDETIPVIELLDEKEGK